MKSLKLGLRFWMTITSVFSFVGGWVLLVHSPKPAQLQFSLGNNNTSTVPTLEPLPPLSAFNSGGNNQNVTVFSSQPRQRFFGGPSFRTGGS